MTVDSSASDPEQTTTYCPRCERRGWATVWDMGGHREYECGRCRYRWSVPDETPDRAAKDWARTLRPVE